MAEAEEPEVQALTTHDGVPLKRTLVGAQSGGARHRRHHRRRHFRADRTCAAANAGPAITLSFVLGAFACAFAGLCYAEMASTVPIAGSAYTYAYATMGEIIAWIIGWDLILEYALGAVTVAIGWSGYVVSFLQNLGIVVPPAIAGSPFSYDAARSRVAHDRSADQRSGHGWWSPAISALLVVGVREVGARQQRHRCDQARHHRGVHRRRGAVREYRNIG